MPKMVNGKMDYSNVKIFHRFPNGEVRESYFTAYYIKF